MRVRFASSSHNLHNFPFFEEVEIIIYSHGKNRIILHGPCGWFGVSIMSTLRLFCVNPQVPECSVYSGHVRFNTGNIKFHLNSTRVKCMFHDWSECTFALASLIKHMSSFKYLKTRSHDTTKKKPWHQKRCLWHTNSEFSTQPVRSRRLCRAIAVRTPCFEPEESNRQQLKGRPSYIVRIYRLVWVWAFCKYVTHPNCVTWLLL